LLPFVLIVLWFFAALISLVSGSGLLGTFIWFIVFLVISIYGALVQIKKNKPPVSLIEEKSNYSAELKFTSTEEECPHCHKMSSKQFNVCEFCSAYKK